MTSPRRKGDITTTSTKKDHKREKSRLHVVSRRERIQWGGLVDTQFAYLLFFHAFSLWHSPTLRQFLWNNCSGTPSPLLTKKKIFFQCKEDNGKKKSSDLRGLRHFLFILFFCTMLCFPPLPPPFSWPSLVT